MNNLPFPLCSEVPFQDPYLVFSSLGAKEGAVFLDSAQQREACGRYSFIALDPFQILTSKNGKIQIRGSTFEGNPFEVLRKEISVFAQKTLPGLPPFQGGVAGFFGYELAQHLEKVPLAPKDELQFPDLILGFYDLVLAFDLLQKRAWIFSSGFPEQEMKERQKRAETRLHLMTSKLENLQVSGAQALKPKEQKEVQASFSSQAYQAQVQKVIDYILAGDIFEANLSLRFLADLPKQLTPFELYGHLRTINPAPFAAYLHFEAAVLVSASPERFLKLTLGQVESRPIKGTRPRGPTKDEDEKLGEALRSSEKDHAENVMIVDLMRNDLSRVCEAHSVKVPQLCGLETYPSVHHLVSVITGKLRGDQTAIDLLKATFPGGSVTGAPKLRAMEIIAELEPTQRGPYCGSVAYLGFDGNMDSSIVIRTFCVKNQKVSFQAGGAVVADSDPRQEHAEVLTKAAALFKALGYQNDFTH